MLLFLEQEIWKKDEELGEDVKAEEVEKKPLSTSQVLCETCDTFVNVFVQFLFWITAKKYIFIAFKWNENIREKQQKFKGVLFFSLTTIVKRSIVAYRSFKFHESHKKRWNEIERGWDYWS